MSQNKSCIWASFKNIHLECLISVYCCYDMMWFVSIKIPVEIWPPVRELMPVIPAFGKLRQEDMEFQAIQGCIDPSGKEEKYSCQCRRWEN